MYSENYLVNLVWFVLVHYNPLIYVMLTVDVTFFPLKKLAHNIICMFHAVFKMLFETFLVMW
jgi:hypothetical protein